MELRCVKSHENVETRRRTMGSNGDLWECDRCGGKNEKLDDWHDVWADFLLNNSDVEWKKS